MFIPTIEFLNAIPGRPDLMTEWQKSSNADSLPGKPFHCLECFGDGVDLSPAFNFAVYWLEGGIPYLDVCLPDLGPGVPIWENLVDYARAVHRALKEKEKETL